MEKFSAVAENRFCPNLPLSAEESGTAKKYTAFNWDKWRIKGDRDYDMINCLDKPIELPACKDLNDVAAAHNARISICLALGVLRCLSWVRVAPHRGARALRGIEDLGARIGASLLTPA